MSVAPSPETIYERAKVEGRRRLSMPLGEQVATAFIAGVTIIFGLVALGATPSTTTTCGATWPWPPSATSEAGCS